jgi:membrane protein implicated in regulation of membrane protease activity
MSVFRRIAALTLLLFAVPAFAYIGPGSGISLLGGIWSVLVAVVLALAAILFWPIRLMVRRMRGRRAGQRTDEQATAPGDGE